MTNAEFLTALMQWTPHDNSGRGRRIRDELRRRGESGDGRDPLGGAMMPELFARLDARHGAECWQLVPVQFTPGACRFAVQVRAPTDGVEYYYFESGQCASAANRICALWLGVIAGEGIAD